MLDYKIIGNRIKKARKNKRITQQDIAEILNVSVPYVSKIETGKSTVSLKRLSNIADILNVDMGELVSGANVESKYYLLPELSSLLKDCSVEEKNFAFKMLHDILEINRKK